jgi:DnaJ-class molecular chaperone
MGTLIVPALIVVIGYLLSLRLHPWHKCRRCRGRGHHTGAVFKYSRRACTSCGGNGRRARLGVRVFHGGRQVWGERVPAAVSEERGKNLGR